MARWRHVSESASSPHYPPVDSCAVLERDKRGRIKVTEKLSTPTDQWAMPDIRRMVTDIACTIDSDYTLPGETNIHHLLYSRKKMSSHPDLEELRDNTLYQANLPIQIHNLLHSLYEDPVVSVTPEVNEINLEHNLLRDVHALGRKAMRYYRTSHQLKDQPYTSATERREHYDQAQRYTRLAIAKEAMFWTSIEELPSHMLGMYPTKDMLLDNDFSSSVTLLGKSHLESYVDLRHFTQDAIRYHGIQQHKDLVA